MTDETTAKKIETRTQQHEVEIDAPLEAVWKAITDADEIIRWFCEEARVTPGVGGTVWHSWGEGQSGESAIEAWEPNKRLRVRLTPYGKMDAEAITGQPMVTEYVLESRGNKTVIRLVHSGIPDAPGWEGYYDGTNRGWQLFLLALRHYIEKHAGTPRDNIMIMKPIAGSLESAWRRLIGKEGLGLGESVAGPDSLASANSVQDLPRYSSVTALGDKLEGEVMMAKPPKTLLLNIESLSDALLTITFEEMAGTTYFYLTLATFGLGQESFDALRSRWTNWLEKLLVAG